MTQKRNIAIIFSSMRIGGVELKVKSLLENLQTSYNVIGISLEGAGPLIAQYELTGVKLYLLNKRSWYNISTLMSIVKILRKEKIVLTHNFLSGNYWGRVASIITGVPVILASEDSLRIWQSNFQKYLFRILHTRRTEIVCNSNATRIMTSKKTGIPINNMTVLLNGFDPPSIVPKEKVFDIVKAKNNRGRRPIRILSVGRLDSRKGYHMILDSIVNLLNMGYTNFNYTIVGGGDQYDELVAFIKNNNLEPQVLLKGARSDVYKYYLEADIFIHYPTEEGFGNVILEALYYGLPILAAKVGGIPEIMSYDGCGSLIEPGSTIELTIAIKKYLDSGEIDNFNPHLSRARAEQFLWDRMSKNYSSYYDSLLR